MGGFGIQSPWAFHFDRDVINDHKLYHEYWLLKNEVYGLDPITRKLCRLYFRLARQTKAQTIVDFAPSSTCYRDYLKAGHEEANVVRVAPHNDSSWTDVLNDGNIDLARISLKGDYADFVDRAIDKTSSKSIFIIEGIKHDETAKKYWAELKKDPRVGITFDLYYCGLLFFDLDIYKQHYIINF